MASFFDAPTADATTTPASGGFFDPPTASPIKAPTGFGPDYNFPGTSPEVQKAVASVTAPTIKPATGFGPDYNFPGTSPAVTKAINTITPPTLLQKYQNASANIGSKIGGVETELAAGALSGVTDFLDWVGKPIAQGLNKIAPNVFSSNPDDPNFEGKDIKNFTSGLETEANQIATEKAGLSPNTAQKVQQGSEFIGNQAIPMFLSDGLTSLLGEGVSKIPLGGKILKVLTEASSPESPFIQRYGISGARSAIQGAIASLALNNKQPIIQNALQNAGTYAAFHAISFPLAELFRPVLKSMGTSTIISDNSKVLANEALNSMETKASEKTLYFKNPNDDTQLLKVTVHGITPTTSADVVESGTKVIDVPTLTKVEIEAFKEKPSLYQRLINWIKGDGIKETPFTESDTPESEKSPSSQQQKIQSIADEIKQRGEATRANTGPEDTTPVTKGKTVVYHTGNNNFKKITDFDGYNGGNEINRFGPGLYLTEDKNVAKVYAEVADKRLGRGKKTFSGLLSTNAKILDLNKEVPSNVVSIFKDIIKREASESYLSEKQQTYNQPEFDFKGKTGAQIYDTTANLLTSLPIYEDDVGSIFLEINKKLEALGYDGLRANTIAPGGNKEGTNPTEIVLFNSKKYLTDTTENTPPDGLDSSGKPIDNGTYGKTANNEGNDGALRENSQRAENLSGASGDRMASSFRGNILEAAERISGNTPGDREGNKLVARQARELGDGKSVTIDEHTGKLLKEVGFSDAFVTNLKEAQQRGAVKNLAIVAIVASVDGRNIVSAYKSNTLYLNPNEINHPTYKNGNIINHELSGHSWYRKLSTADRNSFYQNLKNNKALIKEAWNKTDNPYKNYWASTLDQINEKIRFISGSPEITDRITTDFGLKPNPDISLDDFINQSLNIDKTITAINAELARIGKDPINLEAHNTVAIEEHVAMIAENAAKLPADDTSLVGRYITDIQDGTLQFGENGVNSLTYQGESDLSTRLLEKLKGRDFVSKQFISDLTNSGDLKQVERDLFRDILNQYPDGAHIPVKQFAEDVKIELLPLRRQSAGDAYEPVTLPEDIRGDIDEYEAHIYNSPIKTSAGQIHFGDKGEPSKNYFGHTRTEDIITGPNGESDTRRVIEVQSDLYQKGRLENEKIAPSQELIDMENDHAEGKVSTADFRKAENEFYDQRDNEISKLSQYNDPTAHFRMVREEIRKAAQDGKTKLQFPTGETAMKIEGLSGSENNWTGAFSGKALTQFPDEIRVGNAVLNDATQQEWIITDVLGDGKFKAVQKDFYKTAIQSMKGETGTALTNSKAALEREAESFDISGKVDTSNPIYKFYEKDLGRYLKNQYDATPVTDEKGVTWNEVAIKPKMAEQPVMAFREKGTDDIEELRTELKRVQGYLDVAVSNQDQPIFKNKIPALKAEVNAIREKIMAAKFPKAGDATEALVNAEKRVGVKPADIPTARTILESIQEDTGVVPQNIPSIKIDGEQVTVPTDLYEKELTVAFKGESLKENPLNSLWKYANKKEGTLPEVTGKGTSKFSQSGDDIVSREEFQRFADDTGAVDVEQVRTAFSKFVDEKRAFQDELQTLKAQRKNFIANAKAAMEVRRENQAKAEKYGFTVPEYDADKQGLASIPDLIAAEDALKVHPGRPFMKYSNPRTGLLPIIDPKHPGVYGKEMTTLLNKKGFANVAEAQKAVDNYLAHVDQMFLMSEDTFNPIELVQSDSVKLTPAFETEQARLANDPDAKPLQTIVDQSDKYPLKKKAGALDLLTTPEFVYNKIGLGDEYQQLNKAYYAYLKELPLNIQKITDWANYLPKEIDGRPTTQRIFDYLNNSGSAVNENGFVKTDFLTAPELKVATEIKKWLNVWADRLHLPLHERLNNYITHIFDEDFIKKEFDEDLAKIIRDKIPGETYDPFLEQRLGAMGFKRDVWAALQAYVKRATRKVNMDPALEQIKIASAHLDDYTQQFVLKHISQVNLRPTDLEKGVDTSIKQMLTYFHLNPYTFGARPTMRITTTVRRAISRATFGLNAKTALKVLTQGVNTYAIIGEKNTALGYAKLLNGMNWQELKNEGIIGNNIATQDRVLSATKKFWEKTDKALFYMLTSAENINRGAAYFGAKAKYYDENTRIDPTTKQRLFKNGSSEQGAKDYARDLVEKTQFMYNPLTTPVALGGTIGKTAAQLQMYTIKESEFLGGLAKDKNWKAILRYLGASIVLMYAMSKLFKTAWSDVIPLFRFSLIPPIVTIPQQLIQAALGTPDTYGNIPSVKTRIQNAVYAGTSLVPGGVQASNTVKGIQSARFNASVAEKVRAAIFGPSQTNTSDIVQKTVSKSSGAAATALSKLDPSIVSPAQAAWNQVQKVGVGTDAGDTIASKLSDQEYEAYKDIKAADTDYWNSIAEKVTPIVQQAQELGFGSDKADALVQPLSDDEYKEYKSIKTALYGSDTGGDITGTQPISKETLIDRIGNYAKAIRTDPVSAFDDIFHGQIIKELKNGQIIVERMSLTSSQAIKKSEGGENANFKLDHSVALESGGTNEKDNLQLIPTGDANTPGSWAWNTPTEDLIGNALGDSKITGAEAREYMIRFKATAGEPLSPALQKEFKNKYKSEPLTPDQIRSLIASK